MAPSPHETKFTKNHHDVDSLLIVQRILLSCASYCGEYDLSSI